MATIPNEAGKLQWHAEFEDLLQEHRRLILHVARLYTRDAPDRADLVQDICAELWRAYPKYDPERRFSTWMYRIALNVGISHLRSTTLRGRHLVVLEDEVLAVAAEAVREPEADPRLSEMEEALGLLEPLDRAIVLLYLEDRPHAEIADILGISTTNVATKFSRIKERLRRRLAPDAMTTKPIRRT